MRSRRATWLRWVLVFAAAGAIFYASGRPVPAGLVPPLPQSDKLAHAAVYAVLAALLFRALWADETRPVAKGALLLAVVLASAYGAADELHQNFVPSRSCDVFDWLADTGGAAAAALVWPWLTRRFPRLK